VSGNSKGIRKENRLPPPRFYLTGFRPRQEESRFYESTGDGLMILEWFWIPEFCLLCKKESDQKSERTKRQHSTSGSGAKPSKQNNNNHTAILELERHSPSRAGILRPFHTFCKCIRLSILSATVYIYPCFLSSLTFLHNTQHHGAARSRTNRTTTITQPFQS
jgi:hypothetical protein